MTACHMHHVQKHATHAKHSDAEVYQSDLKAATKLALPTAGAPKEMQRTSAVGHCTAAQVAANVATDPPIQNPVSDIRRGGRLPAQMDHFISDKTCRR